MSSPPSNDSSRSLRRIMRGADSVSDDKNTWHRLHDRLLKAPCVTDRYWLIPLNFIQIALKPHSGPVFQLLTIREKSKIEISLRGTKNPKFEKKRGKSTGNQLTFSNFNFYQNRLRISKVRADSSGGDPCQKRHRISSVFVPLKKSVASHV